MKFDEIRRAFVFGSAPIFEGKAEIEARAPYIHHINALTGMKNKHLQIARDISEYGGAGSDEWHKHSESADHIDHAIEALGNGDEKMAKAHYSAVDWRVRLGHKNDHFNEVDPNTIKRTSKWLEK